MYLLLNLVLAAYTLGTMSMLVVKADKRSKVYRERLGALETYADSHELPQVGTGWGWTGRYQENGWGGVGWHARVLTNATQGVPGDGCRPLPQAAQPISALNPRPLRCPPAPRPPHTYHTTTHPPTAHTPLPLNAQPLVAAMKEHVELHHHSAQASDEQVLRAFPTVLRRRVLRWARSMAQRGRDPQHVL